MANEFRLPELGENIETIQVVKILVKAGDTIAVEQSVVELETDKATIEVPSSVAGTVADVRISEGQEIAVGDVLLTVEGEQAGDAAPVDDAVDTAAEAEPVAESPQAAVQSAPTEELPQPVVHPSLEAAAPETAAPATGGQTPAAPSVRRFAREIGIDIAQVSGSGPYGRVSKDDVKRYAKQLNTSRAPAVAAGVAAPPLPDFGRWGEVETEKMSVIRRKTAEHMALSWRVCPHVTIFDRADITELDKLRKRYADRAVQAGGKLTMAVMVCKVVASALRHFPKFNASIDMVSHRIIYKKYINLGIAVNTPRGLMVPVLRDADEKNMVALASEISQIAEKARSGKITVEDLEGGTFTVTNLGRVGGTHFTPIINYPEVAILGMGRAYLEPGFESTRTMLPLSLSFDHRIIDGADGAAFLGWVIEAIQEPLILALEG
jgi:pyruvate dehydrogenase E2 component (dihydrolipoamide acetyltransferase)